LLVRDEVLLRNTSILHCTLLETVLGGRQGQGMEWVKGMARENGLREWTPPCGFLGWCIP
jgi:hypothetical protein